MFYFLFFINFYIYTADIQSVFGKNNEAKEDRTSNVGIFGSKKEPIKEEETNTSGIFSKSSNKTKIKEQKKTMRAVLNTESAFKWPIKEESSISSKYGWRNNKKFHDGIDITAKEGTVILASRSGKVIYSDDKIAGYGNMIVIKHLGNFFSVYAHNDKNIVSVEKFVQQGEEIAIIGNTGRSTGTHLHFEIRKGKFSVNPLKYVKN